MVARRRVHLNSLTLAGTLLDGARPEQTVCGRSKTGRDVHVTTNPAEVNCTDCAAWMQRNDY